MELGYAIPYDIHIRRSANKGFIVKVGCGEFVARNKTELLNDLGNYIEDPEKWEQEYKKKCSGSDTIEEVPNPPTGQIPPTTDPAR